MTKPEICGTLFAAIETPYWQEGLLESHGIAEAFGLYAVADDCESTIDVSACQIRNEFIFYPDITDEARTTAREALEYEGLEGLSYLNRSDVAQADPRFISTIYADCDWDEDDKAAPDWKERAIYEAEAAGAVDLPEILTYATWAQFDAERTAKRRAKNYPPIANWGANGLDNLPLFVAAANPILEARLKRAEKLATRVGACAASKWQRKPIKAMNWA